MADLLFQGCCYDGYQYVTNDGDWVATGGTATVGLTYHFSGDPVVPNGCYTIVSSFVAGFSSETFTQLTGTYTLQTDCSDTLCVTANCCSNIVCVSIPLDAYSGLNGNYTVSGGFNGYPYWTGGTSGGTIYFNSTRWCLSTGLNQSCLFYGSNPTIYECPDLDSNIFYSGICVPTPTPYDPCSILNFDVLTECLIPTPTPTTTGTPTPTPTPTPTLTPDPCLSYVVGISFSATTPTATPTATPTPTLTPTFAYSINSGVTFVIDSGNFNCVDVKVLTDCNSSEIYYVSGPLIYSGSVISTGTTLFGIINGDYKCLTYTEDVGGSPGDLLSLIISTGSSCSTCVVTTPTPTPTLPPTATPTATPTSTPTPTYAPNTQFVFTSCTTNSMIIQNMTPPSNVNIGLVVKDLSGNCYSYVGNYVSYTPPVGYVWSNIDVFTGTTATTYSTCISCLTPSPTPGPAYRTWNAKGEFTVSCPTCELVNGGADMTFYSSSADTILQTGVYIYEDTTLVTPVITSYVKYSNKIYSVDLNGKITEFCTLNGNC